MKIRKDLLILVVLFFMLSVVPLFLHNNLQIMNILIICLVWAVVAAAWDLIMGFAGIFSFAQIAFFVVGAYGSAITVLALGISPWVGMLAGGIIGCIFGVLIALPCLKLKDAYVALLTFASTLILEPFLKSDAGRWIGTGGATGILYIPPFKIGTYTFSPLQLAPHFYTALGISFISLFIIYKIIHSNWGLAFIAVRDSIPFAKNLGVDDFKYKLLVFGISAFLTGLIGGFYSHYVGVVSTRILGLDLFLMLIVMIVLGGIGRYPGAVIGSFITVFFSEMLRPFEKYRLVIFGFFVVLLLMYLPQGITGLLFPKKGGDSMEQRKRWIWGKK